MDSCHFTTISAAPPALQFPQTPLSNKAPNPALHAEPALTTYTQNSVAEKWPISIDALENSTHLVEALSIKHELSRERMHARLRFQIQAFQEIARASSPSPAK